MDLIFCGVKKNTIRINYKRNNKRFSDKRMTRINEQIRVPQVRVVSEKGEQLGVLDIIKAISLARERGFDLIEIAPKANPPVCKLMDFGKYLYHKAKQERIQKAKQKKIAIKSIRLSVRTSQHDLNFKAGKIKEFLEDSNKVKIEMTLRGREKQHFDFAEERLKNFLTLLGKINCEQALKRTPQGLVVIVGKK